MEHNDTGPWRGRINAEIYDRITREHPIYVQLHGWLVERAELGSARRVLDLACGTGATARACLAELPREAQLVGLDASADMVEVARASVLDPRAEFHVAPAAALDRLVEPGFDRAVCHAAIWQFPSLRDVLQALARVLVSGARFVCNVPAEQIAGESAPVHAFQIALARALEARTGRPLTAPPRRDRTTWLALLAESGFEVGSWERLVYRGPQKLLTELCAVPALCTPLAPELDEAERHEALREACEAVDLEAVVEVPWVYITAFRRED